MATTQEIMINPNLQSFKLTSEMVESIVQPWRKLVEEIEAERDKAREQVEVCRGIIKRTEIARNSALTELTEMERERDEARDLAQQMSESNQVLMADVRFYRKAFEDAK